MKMTTTMQFVALYVISVLWLQASGETCPDLYRRYSNRHTYCLPANSKCKIQRNKLRPEDKDVILREHNAYRSRVATGGETTYSLPKASNMLQMVWDEELAAVAQKHSEQCRFEHDCNECRRVKNFGVGQNLYERKMTPVALKPDWPAAIKSWYDEVADFDKAQIDGFVDGEGPPQTGHFTQEIWADTWRVGCGYSMYKDGNQFVELYSCNYGPGGNVEAENIYKKGTPCSACPVNTCCGKSCPKPNYTGLCQITTGNGPQFKPPAGTLFFCSFNNQSDCAGKVTSGVNKWKISNTLSGSYLGIVLNGGENSSVTFTTPFRAKQSMCFISYYRRGPQIAGQESAGTAKEIFTIEGSGPAFQPELKSDSVDFIKYSISLGWNMKTTLSLSFSVPFGKPPQYLELRDIQVSEGRCPPI